MPAKRIYRLPFRPEVHLTTRTLCPPFFPPQLVQPAQALGLTTTKNGIFSAKELSGVGNMAGRTMLHTILTAFERISFNDDPLQFMLVETSYPPFISFFNEVAVTQEHPELKAIPNFASALVIELRRGNPPDLRDFLRFRFKNGTDSDFKTLYVYGHHADIPLTEFIYKSKGGVVTSNRQWAEVCGRRRVFGAEMLEGATNNNTIFGFALALASLLAIVVMSKFVKKVKNTRRTVRLEGEETQINPAVVTRPAEKVEIRVV
ncbi:hypothetical protein MPER_08578 [Moniliophthora perniciosa FA553]|nr:hypothetical protein MPER_08578 [Moniliophthora perniciosa FA553]